jgi:hypothetical protein
LVFTPSRDVWIWWKAHYAALSGAAAGATAGGVVGALVGLGIPEYEAKVDVRPRELSPRARPSPSNVAIRAVAS